MSKTWPDQAIMMTLSAIAYQLDIPGQLKNPNYATGGDWSLVWGPVQDDYGNLAYVAKSASKGAFALVIRGSLTTFSWAAFENWFYDLDVLFQRPWPYFRNTPGTMVSSGSYIQASNLTSSTYAGQTLASFLTQGVPAGSTLYVTGHSLGGNLATVLASWISAQRNPNPGQPDPKTQVYTFAAPSPGNTVFASAYNQRFPNSWRYWNQLDAVPNAWDNLLAINSIYDSYFLPTPILVQGAVDSMEAALLASEDYYNSYYQQTNGPGTPLGPSFIIPAPDWYTEMEGQHAHNTYLNLLDAPPVVPEMFLGERAPLRGPILERPILKKEQVPPLIITRRRAS